MTGPQCDRCPVPARWAVANLEGNGLEPIVRWHACGLHLHAVLEDGAWDADAVEVYDLTVPVGSS